MADCDQGQCAVTFLQENSQGGRSMPKLFSQQNHCPSLKLHHLHLAALLQSCGRTPSQPKKVALCAEQKHWDGTMQPPSVLTQCGVGARQSASV